MKLIVGICYVYSRFFCWVKFISLVSFCFIVEIRFIIFLGIVEIFSYMFNSLNTILRLKGIGKWIVFVIYLLIFLSSVGFLFFLTFL